MEHLFVFGFAFALTYTMNLTWPIKKPKISK